MAHLQLKRMPPQCMLMPMVEESGLLMSLQLLQHKLCPLLTCITDKNSFLPLVEYLPQLQVHHPTHAHAEPFPVAGLL